MFDTQLFADWMMIQFGVMIFSVIVLGKARTQRWQYVLLGSMFHGSLSIGLFGLWQFTKQFF
jgi:hypothetical protein